MVFPRSRWTSASLLFCATALGACASGTDPIVPPPAPPSPSVPAGPFTLSTSTPWAGSTITITSPDFVTRGTGASVTIAGVSSALTRVNDSVMSAVVPTSAGGSTTPDLNIDGFHVTLSTLTVRGWVEDVAITGDASLTWDVVVWPRGQGTLMGATTSGLKIIDFTTRTATTIAGLINTNALRSPGFTYQDSVFVMKSTVNGTVQLWKLGGTPALLTTGSPTANRHVMQLGPDAWFTSSNHTISYPGASNVQAEESGGTFMSPRHDRATIRINQVTGLTGVPVFTVPGGTLAYTVPGLTNSSAADFSPSGEELIVVGGSTNSPESAGRVVRMNAATGSVLNTVNLTRSVFAVTYDPDQPYVYIGTSNTATNAVVVEVYDRTTFAKLGEMGLPSGISVSGVSCCYAGALTVNAAEHSLYFFWSFNGPPRAFRYQLP